jgi:hypothetical protein
MIVVAGWVAIHQKVHVPDPPALATFKTSVVPE